MAADAPHRQAQDLAGRPGIRSLLVGDDLHTQRCGAPARLNDQRKTKTPVAQRRLSRRQAEARFWSRYAEGHKVLEGPPLVEAQVDDFGIGNNGDDASLPKARRLVRQQRKFEIVERQEHPDVISTATLQQAIEIAGVGERRQDDAAAVGFNHGSGVRGRIGGKDLSASAQCLLKIIDEIIAPAGAAEQNIEEGAHRGLFSDPVKSGIVACPWAAIPSWRTNVASVITSSRRSSQKLI